MRNFHCLIVFEVIGSSLTIFGLLNEICEEPLEEKSNYTVTRLNNDQDQLLRSCYSELYE